MANFSIAVNFLIPEAVVRELDNVNLSSIPLFDWRKSSLSHCTVKAISVADTIPPEMETWADLTAEILKFESPFRVQLRGISSFPTAVYTNVLSTELFSIHQKLSNFLPSSQPQYERENYSAHVSLAMTSNLMSLPVNEAIEFGSFDVNELQLTIWDLKNLYLSKHFRRFPLNGVRES